MKFILISLFVFSNFISSDSYAKNACSSFLQVKRAKVWNVLALPYAGWAKLNHRTAQKTEELLTRLLLSTKTSADWVYKERYNQIVLSYNNRIEAYDAPITQMVKLESGEIKISRDIRLFTTTGDLVLFRLGDVVLLSESLLVDGLIE